MNEKKINFEGETNQIEKGRSGKDRGGKEIS